MKALLPLLAAALVTLVLSFAWDGRAASAPAVATDLRARPAGPRAAPFAALRAYCTEPSRLRLRRFEDGSARLECGDQLLLAVSVPG